MPVSDQAFVTLATDEAYCQGALVLGQSLRAQRATRALVVLVTPQVSLPLRALLRRVFDEVVEVSLAAGADPAGLALLRRPELGPTLTKLHCWALTRYRKAVFLDADTLVLCNIDELFERSELSAAPDPGWPDCFNSGVFVFRPSLRTHSLLLQHAADHGSFDGADQGLLNSFFSGWATADIHKHLPFTYNLSCTAAYTYLPAFRRFGSRAKVVHFLGPRKPWTYRYSPQTGSVLAEEEGGPGAAPRHQLSFLNLWWDIYRRRVLPLYGASAPGGPRTDPEQPWNLPEEGPRNLPEGGPRNLPEEGPRNLPEGPRNIPEEGPRNLPEGGPRNIPERPRNIPEGPRNLPERPWNLPEGGPRNIPEGGPWNIPEGGPWNLPEEPWNIPEGLQNVPEEEPRNIPEGPWNLLEGSRNIPEEEPRNLLEEEPRNVPEGPWNLLEGSRNIPEEEPRNLPEGPRNVPKHLRNTPEEPRNIPEGPWNILEKPRNIPEEEPRKTPEEASTGPSPADQTGGGRPEAAEPGTQDRRGTEGALEARALSPEEQRRRWEEGHVDYMGSDAFARIQEKLDRFLH